MLYILFCIRNDNMGYDYGTCFVAHNKSDKVLMSCHVRCSRDLTIYNILYLFSGGGPPIDRKLVRVEYQRVPTGIYISICSVSGLGIIMSVFFLVTNIVFREHR